MKKKLNSKPSLRNTHAKTDEKFINFFELPVFLFCFVFLVLLTSSMCVSYQEEGYKEICFQFLYSQTCKTMFIDGKSSEVELDS